MFGKFLEPVFRGRPVKIASGTEVILQRRCSIVFSRAASARELLWLLRGRVGPLVGRVSRLTRSFQCAHSPEPVLNGAFSILGFCSFLLFWEL